MSDPFIGEIGLFGFNFNPRGWYLCNGALLSIAQNSTLFSLLGTQYGGDGRTTFALPDLRGRVAFAKGRHPGSLYDWRMGQVGGAETHTLTIPEMAQHSHSASFTPTGIATGLTLKATTESGDSASPSNGAYLATPLPPGGGPDKPEQIYKTSPSGSSLVNLGGVVDNGSTVGGTITVNNNGASKAFSIIQPSLTMNYCLAHTGLYPPRS